MPKLGVRRPATRVDTMAELRCRVLRDVALDGVPIVLVGRDSAIIDNVLDAYT